MNLIFALVLIFIIFSCNHNKNPPINHSYLSVIDEKLSDSTISQAQKEEILDTFYQQAVNTKNDSLRNAYFLDLSYRYLNYSPDEKFRKLNLLSHELAVKRHDTLSMAASYWDLAEFYHNRRVEDSAYLFYTKAHRLYSKIGEEYSAARLLMQMANVESNMGNYTASEISTTTAISIFKNLNKKDKLYNAYNNLGIVYGELEEYDKALIHHNKALDYLDRVNDIDLYISTLNNMGIIFFNMQEYGKSSDLYLKALKYNPRLETDNPKLYAMLVDNLATSKLYDGQYEDDLLSQFITALEIRRENDIKDGVIISNIHIGEYYIKNKDTLFAQKFLEDAESLARETKNTRDLLRSLYLLSIVNEGSSEDYLREYISISDSLNKEHRRIRKKFTKILFETEEYISKNEELSRKVFVISASAVMLIIIIFFIYIFNNQKAKTKRLELIQKRNLDKQEIQNLILEMRDKFEEGAEQEKFRISRELHDGILGRIFGVRLSLEVLNDDTDEEAIKRRQGYLKEIQLISEDIREISHKLNKSGEVSSDFYSMLRNLISNQQVIDDRTNFDLVVDKKIDWSRIDDNIKINMYRIIQESITNIHKHAHAKNVKISLSKEKTNLILIIEDDGIGFNVDKVGKGIGLKNIEIRTEKINGFLEIISHESYIVGTMIRIIIETSKN